jgi:hypothetical protein
MTEPSFLSSTDNSATRVNGCYQWQLLAVMLGIVLVGYDESGGNTAQRSTGEAWSDTEQKQTEEAWKDYVAQCKARLPAAERQLNNNPPFHTCGDYKIVIQKTHNEAEMTIATSYVCGASREFDYSDTMEAYFIKQDGRWVFEGMGNYEDNWNGQDSERGALAAVKTLFK